MSDSRRRPPLRGLTLKLPSVTQQPPGGFQSAPPTQEDEITDVNFELPPNSSTLREEEGGVEIVVVREDATPKRVRQTWRAIEVWTKNRVYGMDASLVCFEVIDRATGRPDLDHPMLGGKLGGGRRRTGKTATFTHPFPLPGTEAMFLRAKKQGFTSVVQRVVVRIRSLRVRSSMTWEQLVEISGDGDL